MRFITETRRVRQALDVDRSLSSPKPCVQSRHEMSSLAIHIYKGVASQFRSHERLLS